MFSCEPDRAVSDERPLSLTKKRVGMAELPRARGATDLWLTCRSVLLAGDVTWAARRSVEPGLIGDEADEGVVLVVAEPT